MSELIAKKYVNAFCKIVSSDKWQQSLDDISVFDNLFKNSEKFNQIINSMDISDEDKSKFMLSLIKSENENVINLIKLLGKKKRLSIIPSFNRQLKGKIDKKNNLYDGVLYSSSKLKDNIVQMLADKIGKKSGSKINLIQKNGDFNGVRVIVDSLGLEIGFSQNKMKSQMINYILKAI